MGLIGISGKKQSGKDTVCQIIQYLTSHAGQNEMSFDKYLNHLKHNKIYEVDGSYEFMSDWQRKIFAGKLKEVVALLIGCTIEQLENEEFKNKPLGEEWDRWFIIYNKEKVSNYYTTKSEAEGSIWDIDYVRFHGNEGFTVEYQQLTPRIILQELGTEGLRGIHPNFHVNALFSDYKLSGHFKFEYPSWIIPDVRFPNEVEAIRKRGGLVIRVENPRIQSTDNHASETSLDNYHGWDWMIQNNGTIDELIIKVKDFLYCKNLLN